MGEEEGKFAKVRTFFPPSFLLPPWGIKKLLSLKKKGERKCWEGKNWAKDLDEGEKGEEDQEGVGRKFLLLPHLLLLLLSA